MSGFGNPFGQSGSGFGQSNPFGQSQQTGFGNTQSSPFGQTQNSQFGQVQTTPVFGQMQSSTQEQTQSSGFVSQNASVFGQAQNSAFGSTSSTSVGQTKSSPFASSLSTGQTPSPFGQTSMMPVAGGFGTGSAFGSSNTTSALPASTQSNLFTTPAFGSGGKQEQVNVFGGGSVFGSKDSKVSFGTSTAGSGFGTGFGKPVSSTASGGSSVFGGGTSKNVFGSQPVTTQINTGFGISTAAGKASSVFGSTSSSSTTQSVFGSKSSSTVFGVKNEGSKNKTSSENIFGAKKEIQPKTLFGGTKTEPHTSDVFGGAKTESKPNIFGAKNTESSSLPQTTSSTTNLFVTSSNVFGGASSDKSSENIFRSAAGGSGFKRASNLPSTDLVTEQALDTGGQKPISSVFGSSKVFGSRSTSNTGFAFSTNSKADNETGEIKQSTVTVFGGASTGGVKLFSGAEKESDADRGRKRTIRRDEDQDSSSKRGRSLFSSAMADAVGKKTDRTEPRPSSSRSGDQYRQSGEETTRGGFQKLKRMSSLTEDVATKKAIVCRGVPPKVNKGAILRKHFSKYGSVAKVFPNTNKNSATIHFHDHKSAAEAKSRGRVIAKGLPAMQIFWSSHSPLTSRTSSLTSVTSDESVGDRRQGKEERKRSKWEDDDVDSELSSMSGTEDVKRTLVKKVEERRSRSPSPSPPRRQRPAASHSPGRSSPTPSTSSTVSTASEIVSLTSLRSAVAKNVHDMAKILDQRDKFIREGRTRQSDLATAVAFVGTCMDMCPEKERYDREDKRRLGPYEIVPGTENIPGQNPKGDPYRMVKEYSRSSADQDEPLPHELRPTPVLMETMNFLLSEIADKGTEGKWMDWYGFLWDRTRGIRKEITQQQLMSRQAVELLEKCARFHIYCSKRLCEEDMHVFDEKINNENLTKCLQTLKEMYHDLDTKQGQFCPHEAEFRGYIVLMNLNEGDTLREIQTLRPEVQNSPEIKFVTRVYSALSSNNYVRFFRLVKEASFLSACIIHRYFTQVRTLALQTMMKAYGGKKPQLPLSELVRVLSFETASEAATFCQFYGQSVVDTVVILDRSSFMVPECAYPQVRAVNLIESKRMVSVGDVMNGSALQPVQLVEPQRSFDENGRFKISQDLLQYAGGKERKQLEAPSPEKKPPVSAVAAPPAAAALTAATSTAAGQAVTQLAEQKQLAVPNETVKMVAKELFWEVIDEFVREISQGYVRAVQVYLDTGKSTVEEIVILGTATLIRQICREVVEEEKAVKEEEAQAELEQRRDRVSQTICQEIVEETTQQEACNLATAEIREVHAQLKRDCEERSMAVISDTMVDEALSDLVQEISMEVYRVDVVQRRMKLEAIEKSVQLHRASRYLQAWKKEYAKRVKLKRAMLAFPCAPSSQKMDNQLKNLLPDRTDSRLCDRRMYVNKQALVSIESPMEVERRDAYLSARYSLMTLYRRLLSEKAWQPLDMPSVIGREMNRVYSKHRDHECTLPDSVREITWKLSVSLPESGPRSHVRTHINKWLEAKLKRGQVPTHPDRKYKGEVLSLYHANFEEKGRQPLTLGVCIRSMLGTLDKIEVQKVEEMRLLLGTCGIIFVLPPVEENENYWPNATARLAGVLHAKPVYPALPLVIVMPTSSVDQPMRDDVIRNLEVDSFLADGLLSDVQLMELSVDGGLPGLEAGLPQASDVLSEKVEWLASQMPAPPELQRARIKDYVEDFLQQEYFSPVLHNLSQKKRQHTLHQPPNTLVTLYNCVVDHLAEVASSASLTTHSCPVAEFVWSHPQEDLPPAHWNVPDHLSHLYEEISLIQLPRFRYGDYQSDTWEQVCDDVWAYVRTVVKQNKGKDSVQLVTRIKHILQKAKEDFNDVCYLAEGEDRCEPTYVNMPWTGLIDACINYRLACLPALDDNSEESPPRELYVYYEEEELEDFAPPPSWKEAVLNTDAEMGPTVLETVEEAIERKHIEETRLEEFEEETDHAAQASTAEESYYVTMNHSIGTECSSLLSRIRAEKKAADKFEKYLENVIMDGAEYCVSNGQFADPYMEFEPGVHLGAEVSMNGKMNGAAAATELDEEVEEVDLHEETIGGKVNTFQDKLFALKQDSHLFEERLRFLMNS